MQIGLGDLLNLHDELVGVGHETIGLLKHNVLAQKRRGALHIGQRRAELGDERWGRAPRALQHHRAAEAWLVRRL